MPRVLITGAAGFIGMHTSIRFLKEGWEVVGLDNMNNYYSTELKNDRLEHIRQCALEYEGNFTFFLDDLVSDIWDSFENYEFSGVIHLAAQAGVRYSLQNPTAYMHSNIIGFQKVLEFVKREKINRFIYASSSSVYGKNTPVPFSENSTCGNPESYYAATKRSNELTAISYYNTFKVKSLGLRFFTVYGPWGRPDMAPALFAAAAFNNDKIRVFNHGEQKRDFTYIDDITEGLWLLFMSFDENIHQAEICNIGYGQPINLMSFIECIEHNTTALSKIYSPAQIGDVKITYADTTKLEQLTGYMPKTPLSRGIPLMIEWYKSYHGFFK